MVVPRKVQYSQLSGFQMHKFQDTVPAGMVKIKFVKCLDIKTSEDPFYNVACTYPNPFCVATLGKRSTKSKVEKKTANPVFNFESFFPLFEDRLAPNELKIELFNWKWTNLDASGYQPLGFTTLN